MSKQPKPNDMNTLNTLVQSLDAQIVRGDILGAVDQYYSDSYEAREGNAEPTVGKAANVSRLQDFFAEIGEVKAIELHSQAVNGDVSMSEFTFHLVKTDGSEILWNEVLRRRWEDGQVVSERYYTAA